MGALLRGIGQQNCCLLLEIRVFGERAKIQAWTSKWRSSKTAPNCANREFKNLHFTVGFWWFRSLGDVKMKHFVDFSLVLLMFRETRFSTFSHDIRLVILDDFRVCEKHMFYWHFWKISVLWGAPERWNLESGGGFKGKVGIQDLSSRGLIGGGRLNFATLLEISICFS